MPNGSNPIFSTNHSGGFKTDSSPRNMVHDFARSEAGSLVGWPRLRLEGSSSLWSYMLSLQHLSN